MFGQLVVTILDNKAFNCWLEVTWRYHRRRLVHLQGDQVQLSCASSDGAGAKLARGGWWRWRERSADGVSSCYCCCTFEHRADIFEANPKCCRLYPWDPPSLLWRVLQHTPFHHVSISCTAPAAITYTNHQPSPFLHRTKIINFNPLILRTRPSEKLMKSFQKGAKLHIAYFDRLNLLFSPFRFYQYDSVCTMFWPCYSEHFSII